MLIKRKQKGCYSKRKYIHGRGFVDVLPTSYVTQNKDFIAKTEAVGDAIGLTEGGKALLSRMMNKNRNTTGSGIKLF